MATGEHKYLADIIKNTHATLREEAQSHGPEIAWQRHVARKDVLQRYAASMQRLATTFWAENTSDSSNGIHCRMEWVKSQCKDYFFNNGEEKYDERERSISMKMKSNSNDLVQATENVNDNDDKATVVDAIQGEFIGPKIKLLDVGSCYNPFEAEEIFEVTAIDLHGIPSRVLQCDFLNVDIGNEQIISENQEVLQLRENSFDAIVFSLFLEYLPCPKQRFSCCRNAYRLLRPGGIFLIVTPDSKHVNANVRFMKSWRYLLSKLGFMRIKYEKSRHLHCLAFRKCVSKGVAIRWAELQTFPKDDPLFATEDSIFIPRDFRIIESADEGNERIEYNEDDLASTFSELPLDNL